MFNREIKKQFNETKYNNMAQKGFLEKKVKLTF